MRLLLFGEHRPGGLERSLAPGLAARFDVVVVSPGPAVGGRIGSRIDRSRVDRLLVEAARDLGPAIILIVKGTGISADAIRRVRALACPVVIYYPDNPRWHQHEKGSVEERLAAADAVVIWSARLAHLLAPVVARVEVLPFGYDPRWFPNIDPAQPREGAVFLGSWSPRRERFLEAVSDLPLTIAGTGWDHSRLRAARPIVERDAGTVLGGALVGINLLHPQNTGAHNMRTREITSCGALEVTEPGADGTPLRDGVHCLWFRTPKELRQLVLDALRYDGRTHQLAQAGQDVTQPETYDSRAAVLADLCESVAP